MVKWIRTSGDGGLRRYPLLFFNRAYGKLSANCYRALFIRIDVKFFMSRQLAPLVKKFSSSGGLSFSALFTNELEI